MMHLLPQNSPHGEEVGEGSPKSQEIFEPDLKLRTTTMPVVKLENVDELLAEESSASRMMDGVAEGSDDGNLQDAALESGQPNISNGQSSAGKQG